MSISESTLLGVLQNALQASQLRQSAYANNIANANTPGYKRETVHFDSMLQASLGAGGQAASLPMLTNSSRDLTESVNPVDVTPQVVTDDATSVSGNANNVNLDAEMSAMAANQIDYGALVQELNDQFSLLRTAITGS
ncbi:MAG: flagellar basal body rod protein FlgB [Firmicutes bacterium]|nr:flagellar basal body rod protein FlgB [Bacillota bacterium]